MDREGFTLRAIARDLSRSWSGIRLVLLRDRGLDLAAPPAPCFLPRAGRLDAESREEIVRGLVRGESFAAIARHIGRQTSTVSREVNLNGGRHGYQAVRAQAAAKHRARRAKVTHLEARPELAEWVIARLQELWSPKQIADQLPIEFPHDPMMRVSYETIYQSLFVQGRGALRKELTSCLRTGRAVRRPQGRMEKRGTIPEMVMISQRPPEAADRATPGHWEGDLMVGKNGKSAVGTLVERSTRYVMLLHLPDNHGAEAVRAAMSAAIQRLPADLWRSVTWDQGKEMAKHRELLVDTGVQIYFCDPHSPWQRGSNENTNGLLRQWMPKGTDLSVFSPEDLLEIERLLNGRPRETLGYAKPCDKLAQVLALTA
jgi:IS30 family transposase